MNDSTIDLDWTEEEILTCEASDEELEAAAINLEGITLASLSTFFSVNFANWTFGSMTLEVFIEFFMTARRCNLVCNFPR